MEKIVFGAYLSVLAAFLAAAASIVKLVNDKESRTTDYRQSWTESVREALSNLIGSVSLHVSQLNSRAGALRKLNEIFLKIEKNPDNSDLQAGKKFQIDRLESINKSILENRKEIERYYALASLHFKPHDEVFNQVEAGYKKIEDIFSKLSGSPDDVPDNLRVELTGKVETEVSGLIAASRHILKREWENVKAGELAYRRTKAWSLYIGVSAFAILIVVGIYMTAYVQLKIGASSGEVRSPVAVNEVGRMPVPVTIGGASSSSVVPQSLQPVLPNVQQLIQIDPRSCGGRPLTTSSNKSVTCEKTLANGDGQK